MDVLFHRQDERYFVRTEDSQGQPHDFEVKYTFGFMPLQQYLLEMPGGRLQAFTVAWDTRPAETGGQRWFNLNPDRKIIPGDEMHWTGSQQNWNFMCADCHSTHYRKNYDTHQQLFSSTWSEINVGCEACHGPGAQHIDLATRGLLNESANKGLSVRLDERYGIRWTWDEASGKPIRNQAKHSDKEIQVCAQCHALRTQIAENYIPGKPLLDHYMPALPQSPLFFADGQQKEEVFTWASFKQSRMYTRGVTCSDCHDPHSSRLRIEGNGVCLQCHAASKFDSGKHHFHPLNSTGASCTACHMPTRTYMQVDKRHDHSFRIPRPDLTLKHGADRVPNSCNSCHQDKSPAWAASAVKQWYGSNRQRDFHYLDSFIMDRPEQQEIATMLEMLDHLQTASITRVTALATLAMQSPEAATRFIGLELRSTDDLARISATGIAASLSPETKTAQLLPLLNDARLSVRMQAVPGLLELPPSVMTVEQHKTLSSTIEEYRAVQELNADRAEAQTNLGQLENLLGRTQQAIQAFNTARTLNPRFVPAYLALAQLHVSQDQENEANKVLAEATRIAPDNAAAQHAYGLSLVRSKRRPEALQALAAAASLQPENSRYSYVYAIALHEAGKHMQAIQVLKDAAKKNPAHVDILQAIVQFARQAGQTHTVHDYTARLHDLQSSHAP